MINIKDKLNRTSVLIKRSNDAKVEYVTTDRFETDVVALNDQITNLDKALDNVTTIDDFNTSIDNLNNDIDFILHKVEELEDQNIAYNKGYTNGYTDGNEQGYTNGIADQKAKLTSITIKRNGNYVNENGYNEVIVDVPTNNNGDYDTGYSEGYSTGYGKGTADGITSQKAKLTNITITKNGTYETEDGYSKVIVYVPNNGGGDGTSFDYSVIGYSADVSNVINSKQNEDIAYSQTLYNKWDPNSTYAYDFFREDDRLVYAPLVDTSNLVEMQSMFADCTSLRIVPNLNTNNVNSMFNMFGRCNNLETVLITNYSTVTSMYNMFEGCTSFKEFNNITTTNVENMERMFYDCETLEKVRLDATSCVNMEFMFAYCGKLKEIELINTGNCTNMAFCFLWCGNLTSIPPINTYRVESLNSAFSSCAKLKSVPKIKCHNLKNITSIFHNSNEVTELGGFENLMISWNDAFGLANLSKLTYQSVMNVINNLYDFRANGDNSTTKLLKLHRNSLAMLSDDDIAIATNKGWILTT